jgi:hypothetical protein
MNTNDANTNDANNVPVLPDWSAYAGEAFNLGERRPLSILTETTESFVVSGFYHRGEFWKAVVPKQGVAAIVGQRFNFSKPRRHKDGSTSHPLFFVNHVQARLKMAPERALALYRLEAEPVGEPAYTIGDFCYSVEAVGPFGRKWNTSDALLGNLALVHRFLSIEDVAFERIMRERMTVFESPPLPLEEAFLNTLLAEAIRESDAAGLNRPYFMFKLPFTATNCTSEPLKLLDGVLRTPRRKRFLRRLPIHPRGYLQLRGLWTAGQTVPTLNEQMAEWLASDAAKERREIHIRKKKQLPKETKTAKVSLWKKLSRLSMAMRGRGRRD